LPAKCCKFFWHFFRSQSLRLWDRTTYQCVPPPYLPHVTTSPVTASRVARDQRQSHHSPLTSTKWCKVRTPILVPCGLVDGATHQPSQSPIIRLDTLRDSDIKIEIYVWYINVVNFSPFLSYAMFGGAEHCHNCY
jgi:hypothetical protein